MDVASSTESLSKMTVTEDHVKPVSSELSRARPSAIATADAVTEANHVAYVRCAYVTISRIDMSRISVLPSSAFLNKADGAQHLTRSVKSATSDILVRSDDLCTEGLRSSTCTPLEPPPNESVRACYHPR